MSILLSILLWEEVNCSHRVTWFQSCQESLESCGTISIFYLIEELWLRNHRQIFPTSRIVLFYLCLSVRRFGSEGAAQPAKIVFLKIESGSNQSGFLNSSVIDFFSLLTWRRKPLHQLLPPICPILSCSPFWLSKYLIST